VKTDRHRQGIGSERGAVIVVVAVAIVALLGFAAITVDAGSLYVERRRIQDAADAAALAGAQLLPEDPLGAQSLAQALAAQNGADPLQIQVEVSPDNDWIRVRAGDEVEFGLARALGFSEATVTAASRAGVEAVGALQGVQPFGVQGQDFVEGEQYALKLGSQSDPGPYHGNFHALALGSAGAETYAGNIACGYSGRIRLGQELTTEPGNMAGPTARGVQARIDADPGATYDTFDDDSPRLVYVPIIDSFDVHGRNEVQVVGFAAFFLELVGENLEGNTATVYGRFCHLVVDGERAGPGAPDYGLRVVSLLD